MSEKKVVMGPSYKYKKIAVVKGDVDEEDIKWEEDKKPRTQLEKALRYKGCKIVSREKKNGYEILDIACREE